MNQAQHSARNALPTAAAMIAALVITAVAAAFPEPAPVTRYWEFELDIAQPKLISASGEDGRLVWYWYIPYKVQNDTGEDRLFIPELTVATDSSQVITVTPTLDPTVFEQIKERLGNQLLEHPSAVVDTLLQGPDHARESIICWRAPDNDVDRYRVFISGVSGEIQKIPNPKTGEPVIMRKTIMLEYATPGTYPLQKDQPIILEAQRWIMR